MTAHTKNSYSHGSSIVSAFFLWGNIDIELTSFAEKPLKYKVMLVEEWKANPEFTVDGWYKA